MTPAGPPDPQRRAVLRALSIVGLAVVSSLGARIVFHRPSGSGPQAAPPPTGPEVTSTTTPVTAPPSTTPSTTATTTTTTTPPTTTTVPQPIVIDVISKRGWGARPTGEFISHQVVRLTYHHAASAGSDPAGAPDRIRGYQRYHQDQGWADVAYHYLIDQAGRIYAGRPVDAPGDTFTEYDPTGHFLVCLDGNFDIEAPSAASLDALVLVLAWASRTYGIVPATLSGHRDHAVTTCPGRYAYELRDALVSRMESLLNEGRPIEIRLIDTIPAVPA